MRAAGRRVGIERRRRVVALAVGALIGAATPIAATGAAPAAVPTQGRLPRCPLGALDRAEQPVEITFWHSMPAENERTLQRLVESFHASQDRVRVELVNQTTYEDTLTKYVAGLGTGDLPDLVQLQETALQQMIDTRSILPAQSCVEADDYDLTDHLERVVDFYTVDGRLWPMPFNVSNPVLLYDRAAFRAAGLDPERPPQTLDEVEDAARTLVERGAVADAGFGLKLDPGFFEQWRAKAGETFVDHGNGRRSRATSTVFDDALGRELYAWIDRMVADGLAVTNEPEGNAAFDNLLGIGAGNLAMTIDTTAVLGTVYTVLEGGAYPGVEPAVAPMPGPEGGGGVFVGGGALYLVAESTKAEQAAAWELAKFLNEPDAQAEWAAGTGYLPIREAAAATPVVQEAWARRPGYRVAYDQLLAGAEDLATSGPVIGDYQGVRDAVREGLQAMLAGDARPRRALSRSAAAADAAIQEYNERIGA